VAFKYNKFKGAKNIIPINQASNFKCGNMKLLYIVNFHSSVFSNTKTTGNNKKYTGVLIIVISQSNGAKVNR